MNAVNEPSGVHPQRAKQLVPGIRKIGSVPNPTDVQVGRRIRARPPRISGFTTGFGAEPESRAISKYRNTRADGIVFGESTAEISTILEVSPSYFFDLYKIPDEALFGSINSFIASKDGMRLLRAVLKIKDEAVRTGIVRDY